MIPERLGDDTGAPITRSAIFHGKRAADVPKTSGVVTGIHALYSRFGRRARCARPHVPADSCGSTTRRYDGITADDEGFTAHVVDLDVQQQE